MGFYTVSRIINRYSEARPSSSLSNLLKLTYAVSKEDDHCELYWKRIDELLSRARYMEERHPNSAITPEYWTRLRTVCDDARQVSPETLKQVIPNESRQTWAEALLCLEALNEVIATPRPSH